MQHIQLFRYRQGELRTFVRTQLVRDTHAANRYVMTVAILSRDQLHMINTDERNETPVAKFLEDSTTDTRSELNSHIYK